MLSYSDGIKKFTNYYDVITFMKVKTIDVEGEKEEVSTFSNFEPVNGIIFPKSMTLEMDGLFLNGKMTDIEMVLKMVPMMGFEPAISYVGSNSFANCATTTALLEKFWFNE